MCLAMPGKIVAIAESVATVEFGGVTRAISLDLLPEACVGNYVLAHAGFALQVIEEEEAGEILAIFAEMERLDSVESTC